MTAAVSDIAVPASNLSKVPPNTLKHGDTFGIFGRSGDIHTARHEADAEGELTNTHEAQGVFHRDTRYLSQFALTVEGAWFELSSSTQSDDNTALTFEYLSADRTLRMTRIRFLLRDTWFERIELHNAGGKPTTVQATIAFGCDFADIFEARGATRARRGTAHDAEIAGDTITFCYSGLDEIRRTTRLRFAPAPDALDGRTARFALDVAAGGVAYIHAEIACEGTPSGQPAENFSTALSEARRERKALASRATIVVTGNEEFNRLLHRTRADLSMLLTETPYGSYPYAGIPWYSTPFGRDAEITALMTLWMDPEIARGVLGYLAANQAQDLDPKADAEPGKILHEVRQGEMAETGEVPFRRYYGSIDSTPLFVMLAGAYLERTGDVDGMRRLWPSLKAATDWIDNYADRDGDGYFEYYRESENGLANQGWKDSKDSVFHADGTLAPGSIALCEVQGYVYEARLRAAEICRALGMIAEATAYEEQAHAVREQVESGFWSDRLSNYILALDGDKRACEVQASNAGHLLFCRLPSAERAEKMAETLMGPAFHSGWGIRTIAAGEARYDQRSYHDGSIWPHDNGLIGMGFGLYGMRDKAAKVLEGLFEASLETPNRRLPELFAGFDRVEGQGPVPSEEIACSPQAWVTATPLGLMQACLGLGFDVAAKEIYFEDPYLPHYLGGKVMLHNLKLGDASVDVTLEGEGYDVTLHVLSSEGHLNACIRSTRGRDRMTGDGAQATG